MKTILHQLRRSTVYKLSQGLASSTQMYSQCQTQNLTLSEPKSFLKNYTNSRQEILQVVGRSFSGTPSVVSAEPSRTVVMREAAVSVQLLNSLCPPELLSPTVRIEHRIAVDTMRAMSVNCTRDGYGHYDVILRPDIIVAKLIEERILPKDAAIGRLKVGKFKRTGVKSTMRYLAKYADPIKEYIEDRMDLNAEEGFRVMCQGVLLAIFTGHVEAESPVLGNVAPLFSVLPEQMQQKLLTDKGLAEKFFSVV